MTAHTMFEIVAIVLSLAILLVLPAEAQMPPGGTVPPVTAIACLPGTNNVSGCDDKVFLPMVAVTQVTGEGGSGILPVRGR